MKKKITKTKSAKTTVKKTAAEDTEALNLVAALTKIAERLEALESKTDSILSRMSQNTSRPNPQPQTQHSHQSQSNQPKHHQNPSQPQNTHKQLYQATCADCQKSCEVPFKVTGERPVYCKECFAARKANRQPKTNDFRGNSHGKPSPSLAGQNFNRSSAPEFGQSGTRGGAGRSAHRSPQAPVVRVVNNGVGKVTVRDFSQEALKDRPSAKSKKPRLAKSR